MAQNINVYYHFCVIKSPLKLCFYIPVHRIVRCTVGEKKGQRSCSEKPVGKVMIRNCISKHQIL